MDKYNKPTAETLMKVRAQLRSYIKAYLNNNPDRPMKLREVAALKPVKAILEEIVQHRKILLEVVEAMVENGEILGRKVTNSWEVACIHAGKKAKPGREKAVAGLTDEQAFNHITKHLQLDLVKKTGHLRIKLGKYVIDVGIVNK